MTARYGQDSSTPQGGTIRHLIIVVHGSRLKASETELQEMLSQIKLKDSYDKIRYGFLEIQYPNIPQAIELSLNEGAEEVYILPLFILGGRHVLQDVPAEVNKIRETQTGAKIEILPYIGTTSAFIEAIEQAGSPKQAADSKEGGTD